jgi:phosphatidate cytidylyltransferase
VNTEQVPRSRLGRDLTAAILVGLALGALILATLLFVRFVFVGLVAVCVAFATWELAAALRRGAAIRVPLIPLLVGGQAMVWLSWPFGTTGLLVAFAVTALVCLVWRMARGAEGHLRDSAAALFTATYVPLFASFAVLLVVPADGVGRVLCFMICVVASDIGGYTTGVAFGRHPLAPTISPKKSWEGLAGSLLAGTVAGALSMSMLLGGPWALGAVFGAVIAGVATLGDLVESMVKRDLGLKDMGTLLPGHGGLLDRMDSLLPSALVSWLLLSVFVPVT